MDHAGGHFFADINLPAQHLANCQQDSFCGFLLGDVSAGARAQDAFGIKRFVMHGKNQHRQRRAPGLEVLDQLQSVRRLKGNIGDYNVGLRLLDFFESLLSVFGLATNGHVAFALDQLCEPLADQGMIIDKKDLGLCCRVGFCFGGHG